MPIVYYWNIWNKVLQVVQIVILELKLELSVILYSSYMNKAMESNFGTK